MTPEMMVATAQCAIGTALCVAGVWIQGRQRPADERLRGMLWRGLVWVGVIWICGGIVGMFGAQGAISGSTVLRIDVVLAAIAVLYGVWFIIRVRRIVGLGRGL